MLPAMYSVLCGVTVTRQCSIRPIGLQQMICSGNVTPHCALSLLTKHHCEHHHDKVVHAMYDGCCGGVRILSD